jgi:DNA transposition AAA+ family ATPase
MGALNMANSRNPGQDTDFRAPEEVRAIHREAAVQASLVGSPELVEAIDYQYQCTLEAWAAIRKARSELNAMEKYKYTEVEIQKLVDKAEREALRVTNILRKDTGVPGDVLKQWF